MRLVLSLPSIQPLSALAPDPLPRLELRPWLFRPFFVQQTKLYTERDFNRSRQPIAPNPNGLFSRETEWWRLGALGVYTSIRERSRTESCLDMIGPCQVDGGWQSVVDMRLNTGTLGHAVDTNVRIGFEATTTGQTTRYRGPMSFSGKF